MDKDAVIASIRTWSGVEPPNATALRALDDLPAMLAALVATQGLDFEDAPTDFAAALDALAEDA